MSIKHFCICLFFTALFLSPCCGVNILINPYFEDTNGWVRRSGTFTYSTEQQHSGAYSGKSSNRTGTWQGIQQSILGKLQDGNTCTISGWVRLENSASDSVMISIQKTVNGVTDYNNVARVTANNTSWTYISGNFKLDISGSLTGLYVYFEGPAIGVNFYVDDANVDIAGYVPPPPPAPIEALKTCWTQRYNGDANNLDAAKDIKLDSAGNIIVSGYAKNASTNYDFVTIKYTPDGNIVWVKTYNRDSANQDYAQAAAIDANSNIIVAGYGYAAATGYDGIIVKYSSNGTQLWAKAYNRASASNDRLYDVVTDATGNIYAVGKTDDDCLIIKYTRDGNFAWANTYNGPANDYDSFYQLAVDASGNVYACGESAGVNTGPDCLTVKYLPNGTLSWVRNYRGETDGRDFLEAIKLDSVGNVYVTGSIETSTDADYITIKYSSGGNPLWTAFYGGTADGWDEAYAITVTSDGNVAVTGYSDGATSTDAATVKYDSQTGAQLWAGRYNGKADSTDYTEAITADGWGNVYVLGRSVEDGCSTDYLTLCYGSNGTQLWKMNYNGPAKGTDIGTAIAVDGNGTVYVTGYSSGSGSNYDLATLKYAPYYGEGNVNTSIRYQVLEGFGASNTWSGNGIVALGNYNPAIYDVIFGDLGLDILRLRNTYGYGDNYITNSAETIADGRARTGRPLKILLSSWAPAANLKSNGQLYGGYGSNATLAKDLNGNYVYNEYAQWWFDSIVYYRSLGIYPDYVSMQNEPDYDATWDSCRFDPTENGTVAGYNLAFEAFAEKIAALPNPPKMLAPETAGFINLADYINALFDRSPVYGYDHHLYNGGGGVDNPDAYIPAMTNFAAAFNDKPRMQTEFSKGDVVPLTFIDAMNLALMMHNSLVVESASAYLYWELTYGAPQGLVMITTTSWTINPVYYAMKHYSAYTDPNWQRIEALTTEPNVLKISAYISPDNNQVSVVIVNDSNHYSILDISSLSNLNVASGNIYRTSPTENCVLIDQFPGGNPLFLPELSIATIALKVMPTPCPVPPAGDLNGDCQVDFFDLAKLGQNYTGWQTNYLTLENIADTWLECGLLNQGNCWQ